VIIENQKSIVKLKVVIDILMILVAFAIAYYLRFYTTLVSKGIVALSFSETILPIVFAIPVYILLYNALDLYNPKRHYGIFETSTRIFRGNLYGMLIIIFALFLLKVVDFSRWTLVFFLIINVIITSLERVIFYVMWNQHYNDERYQKRCLIIGCNELSTQILSNLTTRQEWGYKVVGMIDDVFEKGRLFHGLSVFGNLKALDEVLSVNDVEIVIIALSGEDYINLGEIINSCERAGVKTQIVPYYYKYIPSKPYMDDLDGIPIIDTRHVPLDNFIKRASKRILDILFSSFALFITSPLMLISALMIKMTSPGPVFFKQERVGLNRKPFMMYKFRSMKIQTEDEEKDKWTTKDDPRKTKWGAFMRKTSIDELPQFINVLRGDMSVVGPRPERPYFVQQFKDEIPKYMIKHQVRPGITGWAQINGWRGDTSIVKRIEFDLYYIENWKFSFDIKIILLTLFKGFINKNAY
jgi:Undecaprenyl-phosphate glucose phosphotransferase